MQTWNNRSQGITTQLSNNRKQTNNSLPKQKPATVRKSVNVHWTTNVFMTHEEGIVYQATVTQENGKLYTYIGVTNDFKSCHRNHKKSFKDAKYSTDTELSSFSWKLQSENINFNITLKIIDKGNIFNPVNKICNICTQEKYYLIPKPELGTLNERDELGTHCRHGKAFLLSNLK